jgi:hypothetical protein
MVWGFQGEDKRRKVRRISCLLGLAPATELGGTFGLGPGLEE